MFNIVLVYMVKTKNIINKMLIWPYFNSLATLSPDMSSVLPNQMNSISILILAETSLISTWFTHLPEIRHPADTHSTEQYF